MKHATVFFEILKHFRTPVGDAEKIERGQPREALFVRIFFPDRRGRAFGFRAVSRRGFAFETLRKFP